MNDIKNTKIAIIGLGYVGLPLAIEFGKIIETTGFDIKEERINQLKKAKDISGEVSKEEILKAKLLSFTSEQNDLKKSNFLIVAVPTPVNNFNHPDFTPLVKSSEMLGKIIKKGDVVVYESTVYPGATEEICVPILERESGLKFNQDFFVGYSPERISPADKNKVYDIVKVTSGSTPKISRYIDKIYKMIVKAGTFRVENIKIAEACKVIENTQRDINIAFMNEMSIFLQKMGLNTQDVIAAMKTKWNALPFVPGLVGGHCIGVDPYYLISKAHEIGCDLKITADARSINDNLPHHIATKILEALCHKAIDPAKSRILIMGATFKENCSDIRNARPFDIAKELKQYRIKVDIYDPIAGKKEVFQEYNYRLLNRPRKNTYHGIIIAVAHQFFKDMGIENIKSFGKRNKSIIFDIKSIFDKRHSDLRL